MANRRNRTLVVVLAIAATLLALIAAGAYLEVTHRQSSQKVALAIEEAHTAMKQVHAYFEANGALPERNKDLDLPKKVAKRYSGAVSRHDVLSYTVYVQQGKIRFDFTSDQGALAGYSILYSPESSEGTLHWTCVSTLPGKYLPPGCQSWTAMASQPAKQAAPSVRESQRARLTVAPVHGK
jgi:hypothetical protein